MYRKYMLYVYVYIYNIYIIYSIYKDTYEYMYMYYMCACTHSRACTYRHMYKQAEYLPPPRSIWWTDAPTPSRGKPT